MEEEARFTKPEDPTAETDAALQSLLNQLTVARATELARAGRYAEAERVLSEAGERAETAPASLDLLARMHAQRGDLLEAEKLWIRAGRLDPSNVGYRDALRRVAALRQRPSRRLQALSLAACLSAVVLACAGWWILTRSKTQTPHTPEQTANDPVAAPSRADEQAPPVATPPVGPSPAPDIAVSINIQGVTQTKTSNGLRLEFDEGLFDRGASLRHDAYRRLTELGAQLTPYRDKVMVEIIGTTDAIPVSRTSRYRDNVALGIERARVVYDFLRTTAGLGGRMLTISSRGEQQTSQMGAALNDSTRARTVVLHIISRQEGPSKTKPDRGHARSDTSPCPNTRTPCDPVYFASRD